MFVRLAVRDGTAGQCEVPRDPRYPDCPGKVDVSLDAFVPGLSLYTHISAFACFVFVFGGVSFHVNISMIRMLPFLPPV